MNNRFIIVGFMGCGKSTVAQVLARRLGCEMIDLDSYIHEREGRSPAAIIQQDGEKGFRQRETGHLRSVLANGEACVIALGGGAWTIEENRKLIERENWLTVWLDVSFETCWRRITSSSNAVRPLAPDRQTAQALHRARKAAYNLALLRIAADDLTPEAAVNEILAQSLSR